MNCTHLLFLYEQFFFWIFNNLGPMYPHAMIQYFICGNIKVLYNIICIPRGNTYFNLFNLPIIFVHLLEIFFRMFFSSLGLYP